MLRQRRASSAASFRAGAQMWSLPGGEEIVEITSPRHDRAQHDGVTTHESFYLTDLDVTYIDSIPVTRPARIICDLGLLVKRGEMSVETLELAMHEALRRDLVDVPRVWREWERLGGTRRPGGKVIEAMLEPIRRARPEARHDAGGAAPPAHSDGGPSRTRARSIRVALSPTRWYELDFAWPDAQVFCEFDSYKWHGDRARATCERRDRRLELERHGWYGVPVTDDELDAGAPLAIAVLTERLARAG